MFGQAGLTHSKILQRVHERNTNAWVSRWGERQKVSPGVEAAGPSALPAVLTADG